jgi:hypothetical protein
LRLNLDHEFIKPFNSPIHIRNSDVGLIKNLKLLNVNRSKGGELSAGIKWDTP